MWDPGPHPSKESRIRTGVHQLGSSQGPVGDPASVWASGSVLPFSEMGREGHLRSLSTCLHRGLPGCSLWSKFVWPVPTSAASSTLEPTAA